MKKILSIIMAVLLAASLANYSSAKADEEDGEPIPLEVNEPGGGGDPIFRGLGGIPIGAYYNADNHTVSVDFSDDIGQVGIRLVNETTGVYTSLLFDSVIRRLIIPIQNSSGSYTINFCTEAGIVYSGCFIVL